MSWTSLQQARATWQFVVVDDHRSRASARQRCQEMMCPGGGGQWQACVPFYQNPAAEAPHWCPADLPLKARRRRKARWTQGLACTFLHASSSYIRVSCPGIGSLLRRGLEKHRGKEKKESKALLNLTGQRSIFKVDRGEILHVVRISLLWGHDNSLMSYSGLKK